MEKCPIKKPNLLLLLCILPMALFFGCGEYYGGPEKPSRIVISGHAIDILTQNVIPNATIETDDGSLVTTSDEDGYWMLNVPNNGENPFLKMSKISDAGNPFISLFDYIPAYTSALVSMGAKQVDLMGMWRMSFNLMIGGADPEKACLLMGPAAGVLDMGPPQEIAFLDGVTVSVSPSTVAVQYLSTDNFMQAPLPDDSLVATSPDGFFQIVVPDATQTTHLTITGSKPGHSFMPMEQPVRPGSFIPAALIDLFYIP